MSIEQNISVIVDIQFISGNFNQMFPKELVFLFSNSISPTQYLLKSPYSYLELNRKSLRQCKFLHDKINGLKWSDGEIEYTELNNILQTISNFTIIVKGWQKKHFLRKFLPNTKIVDLNVGCSLRNLKNFHHNCQIHQPNYIRCGVNNVFKILFYMEKYNIIVLK